MSRLAQQFGDLHRALLAQPHDQRRTAVQRLVALAVETNGLTAAGASAPGTAEHLDELAWAAQEQAEQGTGTQDQYAVAFRRARAASAASLLADPAADLENVAYEAVHALPVPEQALEVVSG